MIVKNEEKILSRCLDSLEGLMDEIVIVDTGSTDRTKEIAANYTDKIYDFKWVDDFFAARNFAFSKCTRQYIYSADADEVLDVQNRERFQLLKEALLPEIEIVQMKYGNQLSFSTIYNYDEEYRPKLYKRVRTFVWENPIHEAVRLQPVIYDSDVVITHMPEESHTHRDLATFGRMVQEGIPFDKKMHNLYAKELFVSGSDADFIQASAFFRRSAEDPAREADSLLEAYCVAARAARIAGEVQIFFKYAMKAVTSEGCSEICCELGAYYFAQGDFAEAQIWYYNAAYETQAVLNIHTGDDIPKEAILQCQKKLGRTEL